jgi:hypothetical protein
LLNGVIDLAPLHPNIPTSKASYRLDPRSRTTEAAQRARRDPEKDIPDRLLEHTTHTVT